MDFEEEIKKLKELDLPKSDFVVVGSGALAIRGIRGSKDLDVVITPNLWSELIKKFKVTTDNEWGIETLSIDGQMEILNPKDSIYGNSEAVSFEDLLTQADEIDGIKYINLDHLKKVKAWLGREKDLKDIELIDEYLSKK